jgi:predicted amidohydrolase YtcJ
VDAEFGIKHLRWGLQHADHATPDQLARLKALNVAVSMSGFRWNTRNPPRPDGLPVGARFRQILDSGIHAGLHQDGVHIAAHNPWFALHYATTGLNLPFAPLPLGGPQNPQNINPGQQISRQEAMYAYTRDGAWFMNRDKDFGSIEVGKLGDLVVLDKDYFSVSNADMRAIRPVMTVIAGKVVHDTGVLS